MLQTLLYGIKRWYRKLKVDYSDFKTERAKSKKPKNPFYYPVSEATVEALQEIYNKPFTTSESAKKGQAILDKHLQKRQYVGTKCNTKR